MFVYDHKNVTREYNPDFLPFYFEDAEANVSHNLEFLSDTSLFKVLRSDIPHIATGTTVSKKDLVDNWKLVYDASQEDETPAFRVLDIKDQTISSILLLKGSEHPTAHTFEVALLRTTVSSEDTDVSNAFLVRMIRCLPVAEIPKLIGDPSIDGDLIALFKLRLEDNL